MPKSTVTDKDVAKARAEVEKLRQQVADTKAKITESEVDRNNRVQVERLDAEAERLRAELDAAKAALKLSTSSEERIVEQIQEGGAFEAPSTDVAAVDTDKKEG